MSIVEGRRKESGGDREEKNDIFPGIGYNLVTGRKKL